MSPCSGLSAKTPSLSPGKSKAETDYSLQVWFKGRWVDRDGSNVYDGKHEKFDLNATELDYETLVALLFAYCDYNLNGGSIWYLPPNGNVENDLQIVKDDANLRKILQRHSDVRVIQLFVMPSFSCRIWYETSFMEKLRLNAVGPQFSASRRRETGIVIGKQRADDGNKVDKPIFSGKGKEKLYEDKKKIDDSIDINDMREYYISDSDQYWKPVDRSDEGSKDRDNDEDYDDLANKYEACSSKRGKSLKKAINKKVTVKKLTVKKDPMKMKKEKTPKSGKNKQTFYDDAIAAEVPAFGKFSKAQDVEKFKDEPGFGGDSYNAPTDTITTPRRDDVQDDATSGMLVPTLYKENLGGDFELHIGMIFENANAFRKAIKLHAIKRGNATKMYRNNSKRIEVGCKKDCGFLVVASNL